jgi:hypothetical protein
MVGACRDAELTRYSVVIPGLVLAYHLGEGADNQQRVLPLHPSYYS